MIYRKKNSIKNVSHYTDIKNRFANRVRSIVIQKMICTSQETPPPGGDQSMSYAERTKCHD
jgi:hypothetical protein